MNVGNPSENIIINEKWCKGCRICIDFCPKDVLVLRQDKAYPAQPEACTFCGLCELRCPDFAITLRRNNK
ncbi:MAG: 4Fe-4S binding protein [Firmicutes bacterium]|nr:4Fe-4S binding protein [Bacillota bacterium]